MGIVTNVDGDHYVPDDDPGYCKHGTYVGGCGYDFMCFYCEMGEEPYVPTAEDHWVNFCYQFQVLAVMTRSIPWEKMSAEECASVRSAIENWFRTDYLFKCQRSLALYEEVR